MAVPGALALTQDWLPAVIGRRFPLHDAGVLTHVADLRGRRSIWDILMGKRNHISYVQLSPTALLTHLFTTSTRLQAI